MLGSQSQHERPVGPTETASRTDATFRMSNEKNQEAPPDGMGAKKPDGNAAAASNEGNRNGRQNRG